MEKDHYDEEDSNHSVNGWIKKEIMDSDEMDDLSKYEQEEDTGDRYEELMNLTKEDLVGRILQQEEDIRYLQDIRHGLEKNVKELSTTCTQFKTLLTDISSVVTTLKEKQTLIPPSSTPSISIPRSSSTNTNVQQTSRPTISTSSQSSPRSTPNAVPSPKHVPNVSGGNQSARPAVTSAVSNMPANSLPSERVHLTSVNTHSTVTITRSTNVVIKTEIPSPPPEEEVIENPVMMPSEPSPPFNPRARVEVRPPYRVRQHAAISTSSNYPAQTTGRAGNQMNRNVQHFQPTQQVRMSTVAPTSTRSNQMGRAAMQAATYQSHRQPYMAANMQSQNVYTRGGKARVQQVRKEMSYANAPPAKRQTPIITPIPQPPTTRRQMSQQLAQQMSQSQQMAPPSNSSSVNDLLANLKMPSGITLSLVQPTASAQPASQQENIQKMSATATVRPISIATESSGSNERSNTASSVPSSGVTASTSNTKTTDQGISNTSGANSNTALTAVHLNSEEEDDENDYYDEVAVLIPDKKGSPSGEGNDKSGELVATNTKNSNMFSEIIGESSSSSSGWKISAGKAENDTEPHYVNNDEYMLEEPEDLDSDDNDQKVYLGEDVSLPKDLIDNCIKQGQTPTKLTRNLMTALFPDLRDLAAGSTNADINKVIPPSLPSNKVNAIVDLVQKTFPQSKRSAIILAMNMKCREASTSLTKHAQSRSRQPFNQY